MVSDVADPFYSQLIRGAQVAATQNGHEILLADSCGSAERERATLERLIPVVEGLVIGSSKLSDSALSSIAAQRPMVVIGYNDLIAVGVMNGLLREGVALRQLGTTAVKNVVALINGAKHRGNEPLVVPVQLKVRGSTAQRRRKSVSPALGTIMVSGSAS